MILWIGLFALGAAILYRRTLVQEWSHFRSHRREWLYDKWKNWGEPFVVAAVLAVLIRTFLLGPYKIPTGSMIPTFMIGDRIFVDKVSYRLHEPERGDIIVFKYPMDTKKDFVKRLIGLPGEEIEIRDGKVFVGGKSLEEPVFTKSYYYNVKDSPYGKVDQKIKVPADSFFVLGDNSAHSSDSRSWGFVPQKNVVGKAFLIWWPFNRVKMVK